MGSAVEFDGDSEEVADAYMNWALETGIWDGRMVSWEEAPAFSQEVAARIISLLFSQNPDGLDFNQMAASLARLGTFDAESLALLDKEIEELKIGPDGMIIQAGLGKWVAKCWKKHKTAIIVGAVVTGIAITMVVVTVCSGGAAAGAIVGGIAAGSAADDNDTPYKPFPTQPSSTADRYRSKETSLSLPQEPVSLRSTAPTTVLPMMGSGLTFLGNGVQIGERTVPYADFLQQMQREGILPHPPTTSSAGPEPSWLTKAIFEQGLSDPKQPVIPPKIAPYEPSLLTRVIFAEELRDYDAPSIEREVFTPKATDLIGALQQGKIHYHCGIGNNVESVVEGGTCLYNTFGKKLAVQPHWIHRESLVHGLTMVMLEKIAKNPTHQAQANLLLGPSIFYLSNLILDHSTVQQSIDYEVKKLSVAASEILAKKNPKLKQVHVAFSNGGFVLQEALKQLPEVLRDTVVVVTAGSTSIIDANLAHQVYNAVGEKDWPSQVCNGGASGLADVSDKANVVIIPQTETQSVIGGHYFTQPEYQKWIQEIVAKKILGNYEIY